LDALIQRKLVEIVQASRVGALGTIRHGTPVVSMVAYAASPDLASFFMLTSELAQHTQDMHKDKNVSLLITEIDDGREDPLTLARLALRGYAGPLPAGEPGYMPAKELYLGRFPQAGPLFQFGDFALWRISVKGGRFIAGFGKAFNLTTIFSASTRETSRRTSPGFANRPGPSASRSPIAAPIMRCLPSRARKRQRPCNR